jgi:hypothetical protein
MTTRGERHDYEASTESIKTNLRKESEIFRLTRRTPQKHVKYFTRR